MLLPSLRPLGRGAPPGDETRRGSIALVAAVMLTVMMGFGALAVDVAWMRLAQAETQDIADAASVAALWAVRSTQQENAAEDAATAMVRRNTVAGYPATVQSVQLGDWDRNDNTFDTDVVDPNAARVTVGVTENGGMPLFLARIFGWDAIPVQATATAASRDLHVIVVFDITNSWSRPNFYRARDAALAMLDVLENAHGPADRIGMTVFSGRYAWEFTSLTLLEEAVASGSVRAQWADMETASKAGTPANNGSGCNVYSSSRRTDYDDPPGGCFPDMPREYADETGTDHSTGLQQARQMFEERADDGVYRAMIVLTDGQPANLGSSHGSTRLAEGYEEERWNEYVGPVPHSASSIRSRSVELAEGLWDDLEVHTWVVSFVADQTFMHDMAQGDGYFVRTNDSNALVGIFEDIANALPLAVVE